MQVVANHILEQAGRNHTDDSSTLMVRHFRIFSNMIFLTSALSRHTRVCQKISLQHILLVIYFQLNLLLSQ